VFRTINFSGDCILNVLVYLKDSSLADQVYCIEGVCVHPNMLLNGLYFKLENKPIYSTRSGPIDSLALVLCKLLFIISGRLLVILEHIRLISVNVVTAQPVA
jgi:hypothetical protein